MPAFDAPTLSESDAEKHAAQGAQISSASSGSSATRPANRPGSLAYAMRALGKNDLPDTFSIDGTTYHKTKDIKHDFFAATGFYATSNGTPAVLKMGRAIDFMGLPLEWLGRWLRDREMRFYKSLSDLPNVPACLGKVGNTGFAHAFVEGQPLSKHRPIPDGFFDQLDELLHAIHQRRIAYVDTNKPENILQGDDGRPHLIDFQISFDLHDFGDNFITRAFLRRMQREDAYHILKHKRRLRPDEMTDEQRKRAEQKSWFIQLHRFITKPYFLIRRRTFKRLRDSGQLLPEGSK